MSVKITYPDGRSFKLRFARGRLPASRLKELSTSEDELTITATARNAPIPIVYGRTVVPGNIFAIGDISGDLVLGVAWCFGEIEEVEKAYINDEAVPVGVTQTDYTGTTTQTVDSTLSTGVTAYNDTMILETPNGDIGIAYSVFRIPTGDLDAAPRFSAVIKGRKVYDERDGTTAYSDNPALCLADLASNSIFGLGAEVTGAGDAADYDEKLVDGVVRAKIGIALIQPRQTIDYMDLLAEYAECIWFNDGSGVRIKPDSAINSSNPSGQDILETGDFPPSEGALLTEASDELTTEAGDVINVTEYDTDWTLGTGWFISEGQAFSDGSQSSESFLSKSIAIDNPDEDEYALTFTITEYSAGSVRVGFEGVEVITSKSSAGTYSATVVPSSTSSSVEIIASADFVGAVDNIELAPLFGTVDEIINGSLTILGEDDSNSPSRVTVRYTDPQSDSGAWPQVTTSVSLPDYDTGEIPTINTNLNYPGIQRIEEALNKANAKLQRLNNKISLSWVSDDSGIINQIGDVVRLNLPNQGLDVKVWVQGVEMQDYGRYKVSGLRYDPDHYPTEITVPEDAGVVPVGLIVPYDGSLPSGWADYTDANNAFIIGAGGDLSIGDTGGSDTYAGFSGNTSSTDSHDGASYNRFKARVRNAGTDTFGSRTGPDSPPDLTHNHSYSTGTITPDPARRDVKLMQKTGSTATNFPAVARVFGLAGVSTPNLSRLTAAAGRLIRAAASVGNAGSASKFVSFTSGSFDDSHSHRFSISFVNYKDELDTFDTVYNYETGGGPHAHSFNLALARSVKRRKIAYYGGTGDFAVAPGVIGLWAGSIGSLPANWVLCDGTNGTPDLRDYFIEIAAEGEEGTAAGDNTISMSGNGSSVGHEHRGSSDASTDPKDDFAHENTITHTHSVSDSDTWVPSYYALAAIMYSP